MKDITTIMNVQKKVAGLKLGVRLSTPKKEFFLLANLIYKKGSHGEGKSTCEGRGGE